MAVKILPDKIQNLQQIEAVVAGPDDANRLFIIDGQIDTAFSVRSTGVYGDVVSKKELFTVLVGPVFKRRQFLQANATASVAKVELAPGEMGGTAAWRILSVDADWDDESGQVELRIEALAECFGQESVSIQGFAIHVTILAAVAAT
jgi:hypothetical protein